MQPLLYEYLIQSRRFQTNSKLIISWLFVLPVLRCTVIVSMCKIRTWCLRKVALRTIIQYFFIFAHANCKAKHAVPLNSTQRDKSCPRFETCTVPGTALLSKHAIDSRGCRRVCARSFLRFFVPSSLFSEKSYRQFLLSHTRFGQARQPSAGCPNRGTRRRCPDLRRRWRARGAEGAGLPPTDSG